MPSEVCSSDFSAGASVVSVCLKNDGRHEGFYTIRQWAKKGFLPKKGAAGTEMWSNKFCCNSFVYYTADEVERASEDALAAYWKPVRDRKAERRKASAEAKRRETESQITALQCQVDTLTAALSHSFAV